MTQLSYSIDFLFYIDSTINPELIVKFDLPLSLQYHQTHKVANNKYQIAMLSYIKGEEQFANQIKSGAQASLTFKNGASSLINVATIAKPRAGFSFRFKVSFDLIQNLRYLFFIKFGD